MKVKEVFREFKDGWASLVGQRLKRLPAMWETWVQSLGREDPLEKAVAPHSSILAWKIPWMEEPGKLQSMGCTELDTTERLHFHFLGDIANIAGLLILNRILKMC